MSDIAPSTLILFFSILNTLIYVLLSRKINSMLAHGVFVLLALFLFIGGMSILMYEIRDTPWH